MTKRTTERQDVYQIVTDQIIEALENGTVPWHKPWAGSSAGLPRSLSTNKPYRGINTFILGFEALAKGYVSPYWGTYKAIAEKGGQVRKGEKSTLVTFWKRTRREVEKDNGETEEKLGMILRYYRVFNGEQADWDNDKYLASLTVDRPERTALERLDDAEAIVAAYIADNGPSVTHGGDAAFYRPGFDTVTVPELDDFETAEAYYSTLFHELTHSTGHEKRLNREGVRRGDFGRFGDTVYSKEELVAEMGAALLSGIVGIEQTTIPSSAAYLASWLRNLKGDRKLIVQAAAQAQHAADRILGVTYEKEEAA